MITATALLGGCATTREKSALAELRAELAALRSAHASTERRLDRVEQLHAVSTARERPSMLKRGAEEIPSLAVVKLKPKVDPAPSLPLAVTVVEPDPLEVADALERSGGSSQDAALIEQDFELAVAQLNAGDVENAVVKLQRFVAGDPKHALADNALLHLGQGLLRLADLSGAERALNRLVEGYPAGDARQEGLLALAECRLRQNQLQDARALYGQVLSHYPGTAAATQAEQRLASLQP